MACGCYLEYPGKLAGIGFHGLGHQFICETAVEEEERVGRNGAECPGGLGAAYLGSGLLGIGAVFAADFGDYVVYLAGRLPLAEEVEQVGVGTLGFPAFHELGIEAFVLRGGI